MSDKLIHFAIHVDDIERASSLYLKVFNRSSNDFGSPDFQQIKLTLPQIEN